ncbi:MAG: GerMN domain-containing protein [Actinobacteria bacterium]|nr:GerMN domain-containing protein [Actinomycetota bacterium]
MYSTTTSTTSLGRSMLLLVVLSSCAVPSSGSYQQIAPEDVPFGLNAPQTTIPQTTTTAQAPISADSIAVAVSEPIDLFFISNSRIIKVQRNVASPANPAQALSSLVEGPSTSPEFVGLRTALTTTFVASVDVIRGVAQVDATGVFLGSLSGLDQKLAIAQIVLTLTSRPGVGQVLFSVDGRLISVPRGRGDSVASGVAVTFDDYSSLINQQ